MPHHKKLEVIDCSKKGKFNAFNQALTLITTEHFITVDADIYLHPNAILAIMQRIVSTDHACIAGN